MWTVTAPQTNISAISYTLMRIRARIVSATLDKLNALSETSCKELTATTKRRKIAERDHSIRARLAKAKEQAKQPTVAEGKRRRTHSKGKGDMEL